MYKKPVIMLVDDETLAMHVLGRSLSLRFETVTADSYTAAVKIFEERSDIDGVVTDYLMPGKTGIDLLKYTLEHHPSVRRAVITGCVDEVLKEEEKTGLIEAIIQKPIRDSRNVIDLIAQLVGKETPATQ